MYYPLLGSPVGGDIWYPVSSMKIESGSIALILATFSEVIGTRFYKRRIEPYEQEISHAQKMILERIDDLEKSIKEMRDSLKQNS